ncbi:MAG: hypothetical protein ACPG5P_04425 [Saprospiraceae bacterium]
MRRKDALLLERVRVAVDKSKLSQEDKSFFFNYLLTKKKFSLSKRWNWTTILKATNISQVTFRGALQTLIDEKVAEEKVLERAERKMMDYLSFPEKVWQKTKRNLRRELVANSEITEQEKQDTLQEWWNPESRKALEKLVNRLSSKQA